MADLKKGTEYDVTTKHTFRAEFLRIEGEDDQAVAVFTTGAIMSKGRPALRKVPVRKLVAREVE